jgi:hypothetical protein
MEDCRGEGQVRLGSGSQSKLAPADPKVNIQSKAAELAGPESLGLLSALQLNEMPSLRSPTLANVNIRNICMYLN